MPITHQMFPSKFYSYITDSELATAGLAVKRKGTTAENDVVEITTSGEVLGITVAKANVGEGVGVVTDVGSRIMVRVNASSTNIAKGDKLKPTTGGLLVKATAGDDYCAIAEDPCVSNDVYIRAIFEKGSIPAPSGG